MRELETDEMVALLTGTRPPVRAGQVWRVRNCHDVLTGNKWDRVIKTISNCVFRVGDETCVVFERNQEIRFIGLRDD